MIASLLLCAQLLAPAEPPAPADLFVLVGGQAGAPLSYGLQASLLSLQRDRPRWEVDLSWEPSSFLQSYSAGVAYFPFGNLFFVAERVRYLQLHAPWSRGFDPDLDQQFAFGPELGVRSWLGPWRRFRGSLALGAFYIASGNMNLPIVVTLSAGLAVCAWDF